MYGQVWPAVNDDSREVKMEEGVRRMGGSCLGFGALAWTGRTRQRKTKPLYRKDQVSLSVLGAGNTNFLELWIFNE